MRRIRNREKKKKKKKKRRKTKQGENIKGEPFKTKGILAPRKPHYKRASWRNVLRFKRKKALKGKARTRTDDKSDEEAI